MDQKTLGQKISEMVPHVQIAKEMNQNWIRCFQDQSYLPRYLFHGTTKQHFKEISEEGLLPESCFLGKVYLFTTYDPAKNHAFAKSSLRKDQSVVLYFDREQYPAAHLEKRDNNTIRCYDAIPAEFLNRVRWPLEWLLR